jgi:AcrR family transcriptional regulator
MTVYYQFGSKPGLLEALFDDLGGRHFQTRLPVVMSKSEPLDALAELIEVFFGFWSAERLVIRRIRGMGALDPDFEESLRGRDERRRQLLRTVLGRTTDKYGRPSLESFDETLAVLYALTSFVTFDTLADDKGTGAEVAPLVLRLARRVIGFDDAPSDGH